MSNPETNKNTSTRNRTLTAAMIVCGAVLVAAAVLAFTGVFGAVAGRYENADRYTAGNAEITGTVRNLDIEWTSGKVIFAGHAGSTVALSERADGQIPADMQLRWWLDGDTLRVRFAKSGARTGRLFGLFGSLSKELTLTLPEGIELGEVSVDTASASVEIGRLRAESVKMDSASGAIGVTAQRVGSFRADTASGAVRFTAEEAGDVRAETASGAISFDVRQAGTVRAESASGAIHAEFGSLDSGELEAVSGSVTVKTGSFNSLNVSTVSGRVAANLPQEPGFTATVSTVSGRVENGLALQQSGNTYVCGDGSARVRISTTSGGIRIDPAE